MSTTRKVLLEQGQSPGDIGTASRGIYDFCRAYPDWEIDIQSPCPELFENNPYTTKLTKGDPDVEVYNITYDDIHKSGWDGLHFAEAFRNDIERKVNDPKKFSFNIKDMDIDTIIKQLVSHFEKYLGRLSDGIDLVDIINGLKRAWYQDLYDMDSDRSYVLKLEDSNHEMLSVYFHQDQIIIPSTGLNPELYFTDDELSWYNQVHCQFFWDGPFWIINAGRKSDNELKQYHRWQEVVDMLNEAWQGRVRIVQIGAKSAGGMSHIHNPLRGAFNLTGRTTTRELLRLAYWSTGIIGPISFQFVIGASEFKNVKGEVLQANKPNVVVAGGKEGHRWHVYNGVKWLDKNGQMACAIADGCWLGGNKGQCKNLVKPDDKDEAVPLCFEITSPDEIAQAVLDHYNGGRLEMPEQELWHVPEGENRQPLIEKFEKCYQEGIYPQ